MRVDRQDLFRNSLGARPCAKGHGEREQGDRVRGTLDRGRAMKDQGARGKEQEDHPEPPAGFHEDSRARTRTSSVSSRTRRSTVARKTLVPLNLWITLLRAMGPK